MNMFTFFEDRGLCLLLAALIGWLVGWLLGRLPKGAPTESLDAELASKLRLAEYKRSRLQTENAELKSTLDAVADNKDTIGKLSHRIDELELQNWNLKNIVFPVDSPEITPQAEATLEEVVPLLKRMKRGSIEIGGYTDNIDTEEHNLDLSQRRADAVRDHLILRGVPASVLNTVGYGASRAIADNATAEGRQRNRRIEFRLK